jgi:hypothetical protein|tara:strand:- start:17812 stop:17943 length:132 start_codon:yes stop_codon:yes gene_type:complete
MYYILGILYFVLGFSLVFGIGVYFLFDNFFDFYLDDIGEGEDW